MSTTITLSGIRHAITNLGYKNPRAYKYRLIQFLLSHYESDAAIKELTGIESDAIIRYIWEIEDDPQKIKSKKKNLISLISSINQDLNQLFASNQNPEGVIIGHSNIFEMSDQAKSELLRSFTNSIKTDGEVDLNKISEILRVINDFLLEIDEDSKNDDTEDIIEKMKTVLSRLSKSILNDEEKLHPEDEEIIEIDEDEEIDVIELDDDEEIEAVDENVEEIELDDDEEITKINKDDEVDQGDAIELDDDEEIDEIELDEDEEIEEVDENVEEIELDDDEEIDEIELDEEEAIDVVELDEDEEIEEVDENVEEIELDEDEDITEIDEDDEIEEFDEIELNDDEEIAEIEDDEDIEEVEEVEEGEEIEEVELDEDENIDEIVIDDEENIDIVELDEDEEIEEALEDETVVEEEEGGLSLSDDEKAFTLDEDGDSENKKRLSEQFESYLGSMEKFYNQYLHVPAGKYIVGAKNPKNIEIQEQTFFTPDIYIGKFPVTNALFEIFVNKTGYRTTAEKQGYGTVYFGRYQKIIDKKTGLARSVWQATYRKETVPGAFWYQPFGPGSSLHAKKGHPVVQISLEDAIMFASYIGKRLPTEFEWEAAGRTGKGQILPWGEAWDDDKCNTENSGIADTSSVETYTKFENELGIADTIGNVLEWTADEYVPLNSTHKPPLHQILKGGSFISDNSVRLHTRFMFKPDFTANIIGFRCIAD